MKIFIVLLAVLISNTALGYSCKEYAPPNGEKLELQTTDGYWYFSVPATLDGRALENITIAFWKKDGDGSFSTDLAYKIEENQAKGYLHVDWQGIQGWIQAYYVAEQCGPRLYLEFNT